MNLETTLGFVTLPRLVGAEGLGSALKDWKKQTGLIIEKVISRLFTPEDPKHLHKTLGIVSCCLESWPSLHFFSSLCNKSTDDILLLHTPIPHLFPTPARSRLFLVPLLLH